MLISIYKIIDSFILKIVIILLLFIFTNSQREHRSWREEMGNYTRKVCTPDSNPRLVLGPILSLGYDFKLLSRQMNCYFSDLQKPNYKQWDSMVCLPVVYVVFEDASLSQPHKAFTVTLWLSPVFQRPLPEMKQNTRFVHGLHIQAWLALAPTMYFLQGLRGVSCVLCN